MGAPIGNGAGVRGTRKNPMQTSSNAKKLRQHMTGAERKLWTHLRGRQLRGAKFRRQHQIGPYIVDFVAFESRLVIELDGGHHAVQLAEDSKRGDWLTSDGFTVLRFWNHEVLQQTEAVLQTIAEGLAPHPNPPPRRGEGGQERKPSAHNASDQGEKL
jgi:very-short-patch-repair endonuclease